MNVSDALKNWSDGWIKEGHFISFLVEGISYYEHVVMRDFAHWEYPWFETIPTLHDSGPQVPDLLELTKSYQEKTFENQIWQLIFGIKGQVFVYVELPTDTHRHGIPKQPKPGTVNWRVSHFEEWMSPYDEPSFITEHFMMRPDTDRINFSAYNPQPQDEPDLMLNFFINKLRTQRLGTVENGNPTPTQDKWADVLDKLYRKLIPCRPISLYPVTAPAEAHH